MIKVLYFIECMGKGGKERRLFELIRHLASDQEFSLSLLTFRDENDFPSLQDYLPPQKTCNVESGNWLIRLFRCFMFIKKTKPHIVHSWGSINSLIAVLFKPFFRYKIVDSQITAAPAYVERSVMFFDLPFKFAEIITSNSQAGLSAYRAPKDKSMVIYNGFDFKRIHDLRLPTEVKEQYGIRTEYVVGMFANLTRAKNYELFFSIAFKLLKKRENVTFLCAGKGDFSEYISQVPDELRDRLLVLGQLNDVENVMSICDIGLQLTNTNGHGEGISNSILELCALGKCVIATDCGGTPEIIDANDSGFLVGDDEDSIVELVESLLDNEDKRRLIGSNAMGNIHAKFSITRMIEDFRHIYLECIGK